MCTALKEANQALLALEHTYLSHQVLGLNVNGHGTLLGEAIWTCTRVNATAVYPLLSISNAKY